MNRLFSMIRRRPNHVDIVTPFTYGVDGYRLKWASNFDSSFATFITSSNIGFRDDSINPNVIAAMPMGGSASNGGRNIRIVFNPATYSIPDTSSFWLQFAQVTGGSETLVGAPTLVLPDSANRGIGIVTIQGNAPSATDASGALQIDLPGLMQDFRMHNEDPVNYLYVSTEASGPETQLKPDTSSQMHTLWGVQGSLWVRGGTSSGVGAVVPFSATFTRSFPR
jgi:hypothetical protein